MAWITSAYPNARPPQLQRVRALFVLLAIGSVSLAGYLVINLVVGDYYFAVENAIVLILSAVGVCLLRKGRYERAIYITVFGSGLVVLLMMLLIDTFMWSEFTAFDDETMLLTATVYMIIVAALSSERGPVVLSAVIYTLLTAVDAVVDDHASFLSAFFAFTNTLLFLVIVATVAGLLYYMQRQLTKLVAEKDELALRFEAEKAEAERANASKSIFLAKMSHDLRTPIGNMIGTTELLLRKTDQGDLQNLGRAVQRSGRTLLRLIDDILDLARVEAQELVFVRERFSLHESIHAAAATILPEVERKRLLFTQHIAVDAQLQVLGDQFRVEQIITNVLTNAVKYTQDGTIELNVVVGPQDSPVECIVTISDTGCGISSTALDSIFQPFTQVVKDRYTPQHGVGLGLSIVKQVLAKMDGSITIQSEVDRGTTVTMQFPIDLVDPIERTERPQAVQAAGDGATDALRARILVADDDAVNRELIAQMLDLEGHQVVLCEDGREAIERFLQERFDLVILDVQMPQVNGLDAAAQLKNTEVFKARPIPVLGLTAYAMAEEIERFLAAGMDRVLTKPFTIDELQEVVASLVVVDAGDRS